MNEKKKTMIYAGVAVALVLLAIITAPRKIKPDAFFDQGEPFFPEFTDPNTAVSLEVVDFNEETGSAVPFKVTFKGNNWTIPSHYDYPADGKDQLAKTAAASSINPCSNMRSPRVANSLGLRPPMRRAHSKCNMASRFSPRARSVDARRVQSSRRSGLWSSSRSKADRAASNRFCARRLRINPGRTAAAGQNTRALR